MSQKKLIIVGDIVNTHGLQGEVRVLSDSDFKAERFRKGNTFYVVNAKQEIIDQVTLLNYRTHKNFDLLTFDSKTSINDVQGYKGLALAIEKNDVRELDKSEGYYYADIIASDVYDEANVFIGNVYKINATPAYDLWYIKREGKKDIIVPFTDNFIKKIDVENKKIIVHLIEGMA